MRQANTAFRLPVDRKFYAVIVLLIGIAFGNVQDAYLKQLSGAYPFHEMQTLRAAIALVCLLCIFCFRNGFSPLIRHFSTVLIVRGLFLGLGSTCFYLGLAALTLANAVAIYFALPLMVVVLTGLVLREQVLMSHWIAAGIGFVGVAIMVRPNSGLFDWAALLPLAATIFYAFGNVLTRRVQMDVPPLVIAIYAAICFLVIAGLLALVFGTGAFATEIHPSLSFLTRGWSMPTAGDAWVIFIVGLFTVTGFFAYAEAYRIALPSFVAPFEYSAMLWAVGLGYLFFRDVPSVQMIVGSFIIVGAGLFLLLAESRKGTDKPDRDI